MICRCDMATNTTALHCSTAACMEAANETKQMCSRAVSPLTFSNICALDTHRKVSKPCNSLAISDGSARFDTGCHWLCTTQDELDAIQMAWHSVPLTQRRIRRPPSSLRWYGLQQRPTHPVNPTPESSRCRLPPKKTHLADICFTEAPACSSQLHTADCISYLKISEHAHSGSVCCAASTVQHTVSTRLFEPAARICSF